MAWMFVYRGTDDELHEVTIEDDLDTYLTVGQFIASLDPQPEVI